VHLKNIFGTEEYIQARAMSAECLQGMGKIHDAIDMYEGIKRDMESLIIFEDSILYINVCNQLGNCYFKLNDVDKALENL
jgi:tetratricopeptide (TPR) repeat protein